MKLILKFSCLCMALFTTWVHAEITINESSVNSKVKNSMEKYPPCDLSSLATQLDAQFSVVYLKDNLAKYNYYMIRNTDAFNADNIRKITCEYIKKNNCYLFWGNVANMAMISKQKAAWFPADTSPHYLLSPKVTCKKD
ncbi:hypothetical protein [Legionella yabuuchiae]|uniref:hypothetical protein n=1 Tax=Legionella yabuuchiae TaxID=376727 RepID=UPI001056C473|nr:hypothetical protein [Legionella yabuuchiae]